MGKIVMIILLMCRQAMAQDKELTIGDQFPETDFQDVVNYMRPVIESEELKDKIILIDFWATWCSTCISNMPKMAKLQEEFKDDLKVILVTYQDKLLVERFYAKRPEYKALNLPVVSNDSIMLERFPYRSMPQLVWIGKDREVKAITQPQYGTRENMRRLLDQNKIKLPLKHDLVNFDYDHYFPKAELAATKVLQQSKLTGYIDGLPPRQGFTTPESGQFRMYATNINLMNLLYQSLHYRLSPIAIEQPLRLVLETKQKDLFAFHEDFEMEKTILYCYEVGMEGKDNRESRVRIGKKMQADIENAFGIRATVEKRMVECYVLKSIREQKDSAGKKFVERSMDSIMLRNTSGKSVAAHLYEVLKPEMPIVFEGKSADTFSITLTKKYADPSMLHTSLEKVGMQLDTEIREMEMLVVRDE